MNSIQPTYGDRVRYKLYSLGLQETLIISDPIGYEDDQKELSRDSTYFGVVRKTSDNLKFYQGFNNGRRNTDGGYDFILQVDNLGINEILYLIKERRDNQTNVFKEVYRTELDLSTLVKSTDDVGSKFCTIKGFEGGLDSLIKARKSQEIEIETTETMDGNSISVIDSKTFQLKGRKIYKYSSQKKSDEFLGVETIESSEFSTSINLQRSQLVTSNDDSFQVVINDYYDGITGSTGDMFYANSSSEKNVKITFDFSFNILEDGTEPINLIVSKFINGETYTPSGTDVLISQSRADNGLNWVGKYTREFTIPEGGSLLCGLITYGDEVTYNTDYFNIEFEDLESYPPTQCKSYLMKDVFSKFTEVISNRIAFRSDFFDTIGQYMAITDGGLVRNLPNWKLKTSLKDAIDSFDATWNMSVGIEREGRNEYLRIEQMRYFFDNNVVLSLPNKVRNVNREKATEFIYSGAEFGYEGEGSYDSVQGLDKTNGIVNRSTIINRIENVYEKISPYGTDDYEREIPRRLPYATNPTEDTKYDEKVMILDGKPTQTDVLTQRASSYEVVSERSDYDDFEKIPSGVYDAEGLTNGRWTPLAMALRHGQWLKSCLLDYTDSYVSFGSSNGNTGLQGVFKQVDSAPRLKGIEYSEKSNILVSDLENNFFYPEWIEFNHTVTDEMMDLLQGSSTINGVTKKNFYGLIEFINEDNKKEKGFLFNVKPNGNGDWRLLSYRKLK